MSPQVRAVHRQTILIRAQGDVTLYNQAEVLRHQRWWDMSPFSLPRLGLSFSLPSEFSSVSWFGRGPHENYPDRKTGAFVGRYSMPLEDLHTPYIVPSENGHRCDVRWVELRSADGVGICCMPMGPELLGFSASRHALANLEKAAHTNELQLDPHINLHIDHRMMGVGGDTSWVQSVYRKYLIPSGTHTWAVRLVPFSGQHLHEVDEDPPAAPAWTKDSQRGNHKSSWRGRWIVDLLALGRFFKVIRRPYDTLVVRKSPNGA